MGPHIITFDIDWAPDEAIESTRKKLIEHNLKSTWFVTHATPELAKFRERPDLFELGIHPNFLEGTTHGNTQEEIIAHVMALVPEAKVLRTHSVYQSGQLLNKFVATTPISIDSSIFLPEMPNIQKVRHLTGAGPLDRFPIFWADDYELLKEGSDWNPVKYMNSPGMKLFLFHPIHIHINSGNMEDYTQYKATGDLAKSGELGVSDFFDTLIYYLVNNRIQTQFLQDL